MKQVLLLMLALSIGFNSPFASAEENVMTSLNPDVLVGKYEGKERCLVEISKIQDEKANLELIDVKLTQTVTDRFVNNGSEEIKNREIKMQAKGLANADNKYVVYLKQTYSVKIDEAINELWLRLDNNLNLLAVQGQSRTEGIMSVIFLLGLVKVNVNCTELKKIE